MKLLSLAFVTTICAVVAAAVNEDENNNVEPITTLFNNKDLSEFRLGQCDLVLLQDEAFEKNLGLHIHIRTTIVESWSYIQGVSIKIGRDILEIEGSSDDEEAQHYWMNFKYKSKNKDDLSGFPVIMKKPGAYQSEYTINMNSLYPETDITVVVDKEFVHVRLNGDKSVFGNAVGLIGDYSSGKSLARDRYTELSDVGEFIDEWQVLPSEPQIFRQFSHPQFPRSCIKLQDALGDRRRLSESTALS